MRASRFLQGLAAGIAVLITAEALGQADIPAALEPWRDWVLHGEAYRACPVLDGAMPGERAAHVCAWPGELTIDVTGAGAAFSQRWQVGAAEWLPLPGNAELWPADVRLDGQTVAVVARDGRPVLRAAPGTHTVTGILSWAQRPASIAIPPQVALVGLTLDGTRVARPEIERGTLWLGRAAGAAVEADSLTVDVYRLLSDGLPVRATTELQLDVAGRGREVALTGIALPGFVGERLDSPLPAQLDANGVLRVQLRPGNWTLRLTAHAGQIPTAIPLPEAAAPWPAEEVWSFAADTRLRVAVIEGPPPIDSRAADVPGDWAGFPSYRVVAGATVNLVERSRNDADAPNRFSLDRTLWLDFEGAGFTALDAITGEMSSGWRLDMSAPYVMTMATSDLANPGGASDYLITTPGADGVQGVEIRSGALDLDTIARLQTRGAVPVTGYLEDFDTVRTVLNLPPGHRLLAAPGADAVVGAWLNDWRLLDVFLALIVATATWRLLGIGPGLLAAATMVLVLHEPAAPRWIWLNVLVALGLFKVAPQGRLRHAASVYHYASLAVLVLLLVPFTVTQLRTVVFPQLERPMLGRGGDLYPTATFATGVEAMDRVAGEAARMRAPGSPAMVDEVLITAQRREEPLPRFVPGALVQTGPGLPDWRWNRAELHWTSPVEPGQTYRPVILGRWAVAAWRLASVLGALGLLYLLARGVMRVPPGLLRGGAGAAALLAAAGLGLPGSSQAQALGEFPSQALLDELKARLTEPAPCHPRCAELTRAGAEITGNTLAIDLEFANQAAVAAPLPGAVRGWRADAIAIDGSATNQLIVGDDGRFWLPLPGGVHTVRLSGVLPAAASVTIPFPLPPRTITVEAPGWDVTGVANGRLLSGALELVRQQQGDDTEVLGTTEFPLYVRITRAFRLGLEWNVDTFVERIAPSEAAFTVRIPLLDGEAVVTPGVEVGGGAVTAAFGAGQRIVRFGSRLPGATSLSLTAAADTPWTEHWSFDIGALWHAELDGVPRTPPEGFLSAFEYLPRPGETLAVDITRPAPAGGDTIAIDRVDYVANAGQRLTQSTVDFTYRSTRAEQHVVTLPDGSELDSVTIDGRAVPLRLDGARLELPVTVGEHTVEIAWRNAREIATVARLDRVDLGAGASNLQASLHLPQDRWVLLGFGPPLGSAILYWAELLVFALAAVALGRLAWSPLRTHEWLLLGLGLSTFAWPTLMLFAVWAFAMSWRERARPTLGDRWFNALQIALGALSVLTLATLIGAIPIGLLGTPDMQIVSPVGYEPLSWFEDRSAGLTPSAGAVSVTLWLYRAAMLAWALWLSFALLRWLPWAWRAFSHGGYWRGRVKATA